MTNKDLEKLEDLHSTLTDVLIDRVKSGDAKAGDLNVARQFLKDNGIECIPTEKNWSRRYYEQLTRPRSYTC